jgi:peptidoglycan/LPS O-acetylase OafA/YrhL
MKGIVDFINGHLKAIGAFLTTAIVLYFAFRVDGMTASEWETLITTSLAASGVTFAVANTGPFAPTPPATPPPPRTGTGVNV